MNLPTLLQKERAAAVKQVKQVTQEAADGDGRMNGSRQDDRLIYGFRLRLLGGHGSETADGPPWQRKRSAIKLCFLMNSGPHPRMQVPL